MATRDSTTSANRSISYTINFQVDLSSPGYLSSPNPNGNQTEATMSATRSTWIPQGFDSGDETRIFKHGDTFTAYDERAYYLKNKYVKNATNPNGVLVIVSEVP